MCGEKRKRHAGRHGSLPTDRRPPSLAESATEIATPASVSSATPDDAEADEKTQLHLTPWSPETDGSLLLPTILFTLGAIDNSIIRFIFFLESKNNFPNQTKLDCTKLNEARIYYRFSKSCLFY